MKSTYNAVEFAAPGSHLLKHGMAEINPGLRLHYVTAGDGNRMIVLLHGFPQT
jgi:hypothetical protein